MREIIDLIAEAEKLELDPIETGDIVYVGRFKNRKATVKGFKTDDNGQPILKTNKGDTKLFGLIIPLSTRVW